MPSSICVETDNFKNSITFFEWIRSHVLQDQFQRTAILELSAKDTDCSSMPIDGSRIPLKSDPRFRVPWILRCKGVGRSAHAAGDIAIGSAARQGHRLLTRRRSQTAWILHLPTWHARDSLAAPTTDRAASQHPPPPPNRTPRVRLTPPAPRVHGDNVALPRRARHPRIRPPPAGARGRGWWVGDAAQRE